MRTSGERLRRITRKTWHFFETFVGDEDHWLPPDNFQEIPDSRIAHRTSPTNQGMLLLSTMACGTIWVISASADWRSGWRRRSTRWSRWKSTWGHFYKRISTMADAPRVFLEL